MVVPTVTVEVGNTGDLLPARVSASQVSSYEACGLRYYFESVLGWRAPESEWTTLGVLLHDTLEELYRQSPQQRTRGQADEILVAVARGMFTGASYAAHARNGDIRSNAERGLDSLFQLETPSAVSVAGDDLEAAFIVELGGIQFNGRLDRRTREPFGRVSDYKSGRRPPPYLLAGKLMQLYLYAAAAEASGDPVDEVELLFLGGDGARVRRPVYAAALDAAVSRLVTMRADSTRDLNERRFTARTGPLCRFCPFKPVCPAHRSGAPEPGSDSSNAALSARGLRRRGETLTASSPPGPERDADTEDVW